MERQLKKAGRVISTFLADLFNAVLDLGYTLQPLNEAYPYILDLGYTLQPLNEAYPYIRKKRIASTLTTIGGSPSHQFWPNHWNILYYPGSAQKFLQSPLQFGFTKELSPTMAALAITEAISDACDNRTTLYVIALDVRKAFNVVDHRMLLPKLYQVS